MAWKTFGKDKLGNLTVDSKKIVMRLGRNARRYFKYENRGNQTNFIKKELAVLGYKIGYCVYTCLAYSKFKDKKKKHWADAETDVYKKTIDNALNRNRRKKKFGDHGFKNTEWLYDIHWYRDGRGRAYQPFNVYLVAECELGARRSADENKNDKSSGIKFDFQKLLVSNAKLRLMIFQVPNEDVIKNKKNGLEIYFDQAIRTYKSLPKGARFLFACYNNHKDGSLMYTQKIKK